MEDCGRGLEIVSAARWRTLSGTEQAALRGSPSSKAAMNWVTIPVRDEGLRRAATAVP